jgi:uncharacterized protein
MSATLLVVLPLLVALNVWVHVGPPRSHVVTGPLGALLLLALGRAAGLSWSDLGLDPDAAGAGLRYGAVAAVLVAVGYAGCAAVPHAHRFFRDTRYRLGPRAALWVAFVVVPLATVVPEEVAFRGLIWGLLDREGGAALAAVGSSVLFGVWHVLPALHVTRTSTLLASGQRAPARRVLVVVAVVVGTTLAGLVLAELRRRSGSLLAPSLLHLATNAGGVLAAAWVWSLTGKTGLPDTPRAPAQPSLRLRSSWRRRAGRTPR